MDIYGLIGKKLSHSFSPVYFTRKFKDLNLDAEYRTFEIDELSELPVLINKYSNLRGLNVTIPYKKQVIPFLDELDSIACELGAVNTLKIIRTGKTAFLKGFNTDVIGFEGSLLPLIKKRKDISSLVLGTGGSSQAVCYVLKKLDIKFTHVSRKPSPGIFAYSDLTDKIISKNLLIINTTPLGMFPEVQNAPDIPYSSIGSRHILFDLIYNPSETVFLQKGKERGATIANGQLMLEQQAEAAWELFHK